MTVGKSNKAVSKEFRLVITPELATKGKDELGVSFAKRVEMLVEQDTSINWDFSNTALYEQNAKEESAIRYRKCWNSKWALVKDIVCSKDVFNAELLEKVADDEWIGTKP